MCRCSEATAWPVHKGTAILVTHCERWNTSIPDLKRPTYLTSELSWKILINYRLPLAIRQVIFPSVFFFFFFSLSLTHKKVLWPLLQKNWQTTKRFYSSFIAQNKRTPNLYLMCFLCSLWRNVPCQPSFLMSFHIITEFQNLCWFIFMQFTNMFLM